MTKPGPNEIVLREDVFGRCHSKKCAGAKRIGKRVVYGDGSEMVRCTTCDSTRDFFVQPGQSYNVGTRFGDLGEPDDE